MNPYTMLIFWCLLAVAFKAGEVAERRRNASRRAAGLEHIISRNAAKGTNE